MPSFGAQVDNWILTFSYRNFSTDLAYTPVDFFIVGYLTNPTDTSSFVSLDTIDFSNVVTTYEIIIPNGTISSGARLAFLLRWPTCSSSTNYIRTTIDNISVTPCSCFKISNFSINNVLTTDSSLTLSWNDTLNSGVTYSLYDMSDTSLIQAGIDSLTYTLTSLDANTEYSFAIRTVCDSVHTSDFSPTLSAHTVCSGMSLPWSCSFEENEIYSTDPVTAIPFCSHRFVYPDNPPDPWFNPYYPRSFAPNSDQVRTGSRCLRFKEIDCPDTMALILPPVDISIYPMNENQLVFWARVLSSNCGNRVYVYTLSSPDFSTATYIGSIPVSTEMYTRYRISLANSPSSNKFVAILTKGGFGQLYVDDLDLEVEPSCHEVLEVNVTATTQNSITVGWSSNSDNSTATYSVYNMSDTSLIASGITNTSYTITNLISNTEYLFGIEANCPSGNAVLQTVSGRTRCNSSDCGIVSLPFFEDFETSSATAGCWTNSGPASWSFGVSDFYPYGEPHAFSGYRNARINHTVTGNATKFISPVLSEGEHGVSLCFAHKQTRWGMDIDTLRVYYRSDGNGSWSQVAEYATSCSWTVENININNSVYQIAFEMVDGYGRGVAIDSVVINYSPNHPIVFSIAIDSISDSSVSISWTGNSPQYELYIDNSFTAEVNNTSYTFTGLTPATQYTFGIMGKIGGNKSTMVTVTATTDSLIIIPDSAYLTLTVNDEMMGTTNPSPAIYHIEVEDSITLTAIPFYGYDFSMWSTGDSATTITVTILSDTTITALFVPTVSIDNVNQTRLNAYCKDGDIFLQGALGHEIYLFDIYGRTLYHSSSASEIEYFRPHSSGIYLINVIGIGIKRVVIIR